MADKPKPEEMSTRQYLRMQGWGLPPEEEDRPSLGFGPLDDYVADMSGAERDGFVQLALRAIYHDQISEG